MGADHSENTPLGVPAHNSQQSFNEIKVLKRTHPTSHDVNGQVFLRSGSGVNLCCWGKRILVAGSGSLGNQQSLQFSVHLVPGVRPVRDRLYTVVQTAQWQNAYATDLPGVKSHGRPDDPATVETKGKGRDAFMNDLREKGRKWPEPGKCCG